MSTRTYEEPIAPTVEAIEAWRAQEAANKPDGAVFATEYDQYGVNVWTKAGGCRCIVGGGGFDSSGARGWWTIRGEGSSNGRQRHLGPGAQDRARGRLDRRRS